MTISFSSDSESTFFLPILDLKYFGIAMVKSSPILIATTNQISLGNSAYILFSTDLRISMRNYNRLLMNGILAQSD
jgi:hypothetical protein